MVVAHVPATIVRGDELNDLSIPVGTTVAGVLTQVNRHRETYALFDELGHRVDGREVFGNTITAGAVLYARPTQSQVLEQAGAQPAEGTARTLAMSPHVAIGLLCIVAACLAISPALLPPTPTGWMLRLALAVLLILAFALLLLRRTAQGSILGAALTPVPAAVAAATLVPYPQLVPEWGFALTAVWAGLIAAHLARTLQRNEYTDAAVRLWLVPAVLLSLISLLRVPLAMAAPVTTAVAVVMLAFSPQQALQVPQHQLLHLPALMTTAPWVHQPEVQVSGPITHRRVFHTWQRNVGARWVSVTLACLLTLAGVPPLLSRIHEGTLESWCSLALGVNVLLFLLLYPRDQRSNYARWAPRLSAVAVIAIGVLITAATAPSGGETTLSTAIGLAAVLFALVSGVWLARGMYAPWLTRLADLLEQLTLLATIPLTAVAAGLFSYIRAV